MRFYHHKPEKMTIGIGDGDSWVRIWAVGDGLADGIVGWVVGWATWVAACQVVDWGIGLGVGS
jgi:hypothetical protein